MFAKVLVANRGEIALRVIRTCRDLGIRTVAVYSEADRHALHVRFADEAVCIGPAPATRSYLHVPAVLGAAEITGADAVHPGYGFLAENAAFAAAVRGAGLAFVGPSAEHLRLFGDKGRAKAVAREVGVSLLGGSDEAGDDVEVARTAAQAAGFPVVLKAAAGGGGKGMRVVYEPSSFTRAFELCAQEAAAAFGSSQVLVERFLDRPRHVEVQIAADGTRAVAVGTRDCTLQRRHQKLVEEAPAPFLDDALVARLTGDAVRLCEHVGYRTLATVEFLVQDGEHFFLEVNPRIQVEHPVTEVTTGLDLVAHQLALAAGEPLAMSDDDVRPTGHAIEARINAEHPWSLVPSPGRIQGWHAPGGPGIRVDAAAHEGAFVPPHYDPLIAKVIAYGADREQARRRLLRALDEVVAEGIRTSVPLLQALLREEAFASLDVHTRYVDGWLVRRAAKD